MASEKPSISGQKQKVRKRTEVTKYDRPQFRDAIIGGLAETTDIPSIEVFLDDASNKLDYKRYADVLLDILIVGGILAPGGSIQDELTKKTNACIFSQKADYDAIKEFFSIFIKILRRFKYLENKWEEEMKKILKFLKNFSEEERLKLAITTALFLSNSMMPASILSSVYQIDALVKEEHALNFITEVFRIWLKEREMSSITSVLKKGLVDDKIDKFFPASKRFPAEIEKHFINAGLGTIATFQSIQVTSHYKRQLKFKLDEIMKQDEPSMEEINFVCKESLENLQDSDICMLLWRTVMSACEWNKKEELLAEQALKHLELYAPLFRDFAESGKAQLILILKIQDYCYDNMSFLKIFHKIILLFYIADVITEDAILKWYNELHLPKGKVVFLDNMNPMIEWLATAEEETLSDEEKERIPIENDTHAIL